MRRIFLFLIFALCLHAQNPSNNKINFPKITVGMKEVFSQIQLKRTKEDIISLFGKPMMQSCNVATQDGSIHCELGYILDSADERHAVKENLGKSYIPNMMPVIFFVFVNNNLVAIDINYIYLPKI